MNLSISNSADSVPRLHRNETPTKPVEARKETPTKHVEAGKESTPVASPKENGPIKSAPTSASKTPEPPKKFEPLKAPVPQNQVPPQVIRQGVSRGPQKFNPMTKKPATPQRIMLDDMPHRTWTKSKNIKVKLICALDESTFVLCEDNDEVGQIYDAVAEEVTKFVKGKKKEEYMPLKGEVVLAMFENEWYRAFALKPDHDAGVVVKYIDFGNVEIVLPSDIMPIGESLKFDVCTRDYVIDNYGDNLTKKQLDILESGTFPITNVREGKDKVWNCEILGF